MVEPPDPYPHFSRPGWGGRERRPGVAGVSLLDMTTGVFVADLSGAPSGAQVFGGGIPVVSPPATFSFPSGKLGKAGLGTRVLQ